MPRRRGWVGPTATPTRFIFGCILWASTGSGWWCPPPSSSMPANTSQLPSVPTTAPGRRRTDSQNPFGPDPEAPQPLIFGTETLGGTQDLCSPVAPGPRTPGTPWSQLETRGKGTELGGRWGLLSSTGCPRIGLCFLRWGFGGDEVDFNKRSENGDVWWDGVGGSGWGGVRGGWGELRVAEVGARTRRRKERRCFLSDSGGEGASCQQQPMGNQVACAG